MSNFARDYILGLLVNADEDGVIMLPTFDQALSCGEIMYDDQMLKCYVNKDADTIVNAAALTKGVRFEIIVIMILNLVIGFLGVILLVIGIFVALPVIIASTAVVYNLLDKNNSAAVSAE